MHLAQLTAQGDVVIAFTDQKEAVKVEELLVQLLADAAAVASEPEFGPDPQPNA